MKLSHRTYLEITLLILLIAVGLRLTAHRSPPPDPIPILKQIQTAYSEKDFRGCEKLCRMELENEPGDLTISRWLGMAQREQGQLKESQQTFDQAIASVQTPAKWLMFPLRLSNLHRERAVLLRKTKGLKAAHSDAVAAIELLNTDASIVDAELSNLAGIATYADTLNVSQSLGYFMSAQAMKSTDPRFQAHIDRCQNANPLAVLDTCGETDCVLCYPPKDR